MFHMATAGKTKSNRHSAEEEEGVKSSKRGKRGRGREINCLGRDLKCIFVHNSSIGIVAG